MMRTASTLAIIGGSVLVAAQNEAEQPAGDVKMHLSQKEVKNYWKAENLEEAETNAVTFIEMLVETDLPQLLLAAGIFLFFVSVAYSLPEVLSRMLYLVGVRERFSRGVAVILSPLLFILGVLISLAVFDLDVGHYVVVLGVGSLVLTYGLGTELSNIFGGIMLPFYPPVEVGKVISIQGITGVVVLVGLRWTKLAVEAEPPATKKFVWIPNHYFPAYPCEELQTAPAIESATSDVETSTNSSAYSFDTSRKDQ